ncbi:MAG: OmpW family protein [Methylobacteriaceae bacterium]|nr:OmpW family protein [Methylobacteriaceae bacterium]
MTGFVRLALGAAFLGLAALPAAAADLPTAKGVAPAPVVDMWSPWMVRVRAIGVLPQDGGSGRVYLPGGALIAGSNVGVSNSVVPEIDISYFFTRNIAVEAICCLTPHTIKAKGSIAALGTIGKAVVFPPTVMLQYHFTGLGAFKPYVGVGVNYTHYFRNGTGPNFTGLKINDSWGVAGQIGFDYMLDQHWGINFDVKKVMMQPKAKVTLLPGGPVPLSAKVKIDPWIVGMGVTYRF